MIDFRAPVGNTAEWAFATPFTTSLAALAFFQQWLPVEPAANPIGLNASNGLALVFGVR